MGFDKNKNVPNKNKGNKGGVATEKKANKVNVAGQDETERQATVQVVNENTPVYKKVTYKDNVYLDEAYLKNLPHAARAMVQSIKHYKNILGNVRGKDDVMNAKLNVVLTYNNGLSTANVVAVINVLKDVYENDKNIILTLRSEGRWPYDHYNLKRFNAILDVIIKDDMSTFDFGQEATLANYSVAIKKVIMKYFPEAN